MAGPHEPEPAQPGWGVCIALALVVLTVVVVGWLALVDHGPVVATSAGPAPWTGGLTAFPIG